MVLYIQAHFTPERKGMARRLASLVLNYEIIFC